jgi:hypothetical protein
VDTVLARWGALLGLCLAAACGSGTPSHDAAAPSRTVDTKGYSLSCTSVADCFAVYTGAIGCCGAGCPNTAIRAVDLQKYMSTLAQVPSCTIQPPCVSLDPNCDGRLSCNAGVCEFDLPDAGAGD